jgi:small subunit ribosomal protein S16
VAVKIRLKRMGKIRAPFYRVVVMDSRTKRDGRAIEEIGKYHPTEEPSLIDINSERAQYWLSQGARPTEAVEALLKVTGDWQRFTGEAGAEGSLKVRKPRPSKKELYEAAVAAAGKGAEPTETSTPRRRPVKKAEEATPTAEAATPTAEAATPTAEAATPTAEAATPTAKAATQPDEVAPPADTDSGAASATGTDADADAGDTTAAGEAKA